MTTTRAKALAFRPAHLAAAFLAAAFLLLGQGCAQSAAKQTAVGTARALLWEIKDGNSSVWLMGSIHMATPEIYPLASVIDSAFAQSQALGVEVDIDSLAPEQVATEMFGEGFYAPTDSLPAHVPPALMHRLDSLLDEWGMPKAAFYRMKPWVVGLQLGTVALQNLDLDPELGVDRHFLRQARERGIPVLSLETLGQQADMFKGLSDTTSVQMLEWNLEDLSRIDTTVGQMVRAFRTGDDAALQELLFSEEFNRADFRELRERIYTRRNIQMAEKVRGYLQQDKCVFVVVGAAHLVGAEGVPALLAKSGLAVKKY